MITQKNEENKPETEEEKINEFRKEFEELPLEKKIASLVELEVIAWRNISLIILIYRRKSYGCDGRIWFET